MKKSGLADSPFFAQQNVKSPTADPGVPAERNNNHSAHTTPGKKTDVKRDTMTPRYHDTTVSRYYDTMIELVRRGVKDYGKEAAARS